MRFTLVLMGAWAAAASAAAVVRPRLGKNLKDSEFPKFQLLSLADAEAGRDIDKTDYSNPYAPVVHGHDKVELASTSTSTVVPVTAVHVQTAAEAACSANPNMRFEWRDYSASDRLAFVKGIKCLMNKPPSGKLPPATSRYEDFVRLHQLYMPNVHGNPIFLVWHRYLTWAFEQAMRAECGFNRAWPWWDETLDAGAFARSPLVTDPRYFGAMPAAVDGDPVCITDGEFGNLTCNIGPGTNNAAHCLSRAVNEGLTAECNAKFVATCNARTSYADMESCWEYGPHAYGHDGVGAVMSDVAASPSDPLFWMHHTFVDHGFRLWQNMAVANRTTTINGNDAQGKLLTMDTVVHMGGIVPDVPIRSLMNTLGGVSIGGVPFCYRYNY